MKRSILFLLAMVLCLPFFAGSAHAEEDQMKEHLTYFNEVGTILMGDPASGVIFYEKNAEQSVPVASMSKLMTYYVVKKAIEAGEIQLDQTVQISAHAATFNYWESSNYGLNAGDTMSVERLLKGMMVVSGNDAAAALAEAVSGSEEKFATRMNEEAEAMGLSQSHFINASGFTINGDMNRMSARDLFQLSSAIIREFPEVKDYSEILKLEEPERKFSHESTIVPYKEGIPGTLGLKTGTTDEAGYCFTGWFDLSKTNPENTLQLVTIVMGCDLQDQRWRTTKELVDFAAGSFSAHNIVETTRPLTTVELPGSQERTVELYPSQSFSTVTYNNAKFDLVYHIDHSLQAPTPEGQVFGQVEIKRGEDTLETVDLVAHVPTHRMGFLEKLGEFFSQSGKFFFGLFGLD